MGSKTQATIDLINAAHTAGVEISLPEDADFWLSAAARQRGEDAG